MDKMPTVFSVLAALMGAAGMALAAASTHVAAGVGLDSAANLLLFHATAILGGTALTQLGVLSRPPALVALTGWVVGAPLFAADISMRAFAGHRLFPMAAPTGGTVMLAGWVALGLAALLGFRKK
jgi:uncharacterized membrane protein YgdD (TMEM256/DUF423 family)